VNIIRKIRRKEKTKGYVGRAHQLF